MSTANAVETREVNVLRATNYNATAEEFILLHDDLMILRVRPDLPVIGFKAGQYTLLGLGSWERGVDVNEATSNLSQASVIKRAYSISSTLVVGRGRIVRAAENGVLECYIALVRRVDGRTSMLTPRLFALRTGDRLFCDRRVRGRYTLDGIDDESDVLFAATGTGEAPHNAMLAELLLRGHRGRIVSTVCVRYQRDLGYLDAHRELEKRFANYRYLPLTTRERINIDPDAKGYVGKRYLQDYLASGDLEHDAAWAISPENAHVFLCGNPQMIGAGIAAKKADSSGMVELLQQRGFAHDAKDVAGNIHYERYW